MSTGVRKNQRGMRMEASAPRHNGMVLRLFNNNGGVEVPPWVVDHDSYRRWAKSDAFPDRGWFSYLDGIFWADLSMEQIRHNFIKGTFAARLTLLTEEEETGMYV